MDLDRWIPQPVSFVLDGVSFAVRELSLAAQARLQAWLREHTPHPVAAVKDHLKGLSPEDRAVVLEAATRDAAQWPPKVGSPAAARALLTDARGQALVLLEGLRAADPDAPPEKAEWLSRRLNLTRNAALSRRVIGVIFGTGGDEPEPETETDDAGADAPKV